MIHNCSVNFQYSLYIFRWSLIGYIYINECKSSSSIDFFIIIHCPLSFFVAFVLKSGLFDIRIATTTFSSFPFAYLFPYPHFLSVCVFHTEVSLW